MFKKVFQDLVIILKNVASSNINTVSGVTRRPVRYDGKNLMAMGEKRKR